MHGQTTLKQQCAIFKFQILSTYPTSEVLRLNLTSLYLCQNCKVNYVTLCRMYVRLFSTFARCPIDNAMTALRFCPTSMLYISILHNISIPQNLVNSQYAKGSDKKTFLFLTQNTADLRSWWLTETNKLGNYIGILIKYRTPLLFQEHMKSQLYNYNSTFQTCKEENYFQ